MLKREFRLTDNKDFQTVYRRGRYNVTALFNVNVLANRLGITKVGIVVNKKVAKKAHDRNAVKRQVREIVRLALPKVKSGFSIVISIKQPALAADYKAIERELMTAFAKLGLLADENTQKNN